MSQNPQKPRSNQSNNNQPLTPAQQKRQNVLQMREDRDRREREAKQQGRLVLIATMAVVIVVIAGLIAYAVLSGSKNNNNSSLASNSTTPVVAATQPAGAASSPAANSSGGVPPVNGNEVTTPSGLRYIDTQVGTGATPAKGQTITANYTGYLESGKVFDTSIGRQPFSFTLGAGQVIKGWDEGFATMKVGGKRRLIIPPDLGYGSRGAGGVIPANATLIFDVELLDTK